MPPERDSSPLPCFQHEGAIAVLTGRVERLEDRSDKLSTKQDEVAARTTKLESKTEAATETFHRYLWPVLLVLATFLLNKYGR